MHRFLQPVTLQVNFHDTQWAVGRPAAWVLVALAVVSDLVAQRLVGNPGVVTVLMSLLTFGIGLLPVRLTAVLATLYITQSLGSLVWVTTLVFVGLSKPAVELLAGAWQLWCFVAVISLLLRYIRTPKLAH